MRLQLQLRLEEEEQVDQDWMIRRMQSAASIPFAGIAVMPMHHVHGVSSLFRWTDGMLNRQGTIPSESIGVRNL